MTNENQMWEAKDKRISFQSLFSSLCELYKGTTPDESLVGDLEKMAYLLNANLHKKYAYVEKSSGQPTQPAKGSGAKKKPSVKKSDTKCPLCPNVMNELEGDYFSQWNNQTQHYRMLVCPDSRKDGSGKCKQQPIKLPNLQEEQQANFNDQVTDDANNIPTIEEGGY